MKKYTMYPVAILLVLLFQFSPAFSERCCIGITGNVDWDPSGEINVADLSYLVDYLFKGGPQPPCLAEADLNVDDDVNVADLSYLVDYLFKSGPEPLECPPDVVDSVILPLAIGNEWITEVTEYNESGQVTGQFTGTGTVVGDTMINDWPWYFLETDTSGTDTSLWTNRDDGAWAWTDSAGTPEVLMLKYPAVPGESYSVYSVSVAVEAVDMNVTVPAGTFSCYYYRVYIPIFGTIGKIWAAPDIGIVRAEEYGLSLFGTYLSREVELTSYSLVVQQ